MIKGKVENYIKEHANIKSKYYNKNRREDCFRVGDKVWLYEPALIQGKSNKSISRYEGPYIITEQKSPNTFKLNFPSKANRSNIVNVQRLKRFYDRKELLTNDENNKVDNSKRKQCDSESKVKQCESKNLNKEKFINRSEKRKNRIRKKVMEKNKPRIILSDSYSSSLSSASSNTSLVTNLESQDEPRNES